MDKYAVIGNPIAHSKSPLIHEAFARQTGEVLSYERILAPLNQFASTISRLVDEGFRGANITVPFKFEAYSLCHSLSERARMAGAVNTLSFVDGVISGDNTDGAGLVTDILQNHAFSILGKDVLIIGAGGASEGVLFPLIAQSPSSLSVVNRTVTKAENMMLKASTMASTFNIKLNVETFESLQGKRYDLIINATSTGLSEQSLPLPNSLFKDAALAYEMMYGTSTPFTRYAEQNSCKTILDGLGMLVEQAAEAFYIWRGIRPETSSVIKHIRQQT